MTKTLVQTTQDEATYTTEETTSTVITEHMLLKNEYGTNGYMTGLNAEMYRCMAYIFHGNSGVLDYNMTPWNIIDKTGQIADLTELSNQLGTLKDTLVASGINDLTSIGYTWNEETESVYLEFNFNGTVFTIDPILQDILK